MGGGRRPVTVRRALGLALVGALLSATATAAPTRAAGTETAINACQMSANGLYSNMLVTAAGTASAVSPARIDLTGLSIGTTIPSHVYLELYALGFYVAGYNPVGVTASLTVTATGTVEGVQSRVATSLMEVTITDPDGIKATGDESVSASPPILRPLAAMTWTPTGGEIQFSQTAATFTTNHFFGTLTATLTCVPGSTPDRLSVLPAEATPFETIVPPAAPVCLDRSLIAGRSTTTSVDLPGLCSDANGDLDPASADIVSGPTGGTAALSPAGILTYTHTDPSVLSDAVVVTMADGGGLVSNPFTIAFDIRSLRLMTQDATDIELTEVSLDGGAQIGVGALNTIVVTNLPASGLGFTVSAYASDLGPPEIPTTSIDLDGDGDGDVTVPACAVAGSLGRLCIPARNVGWIPSAAVLSDDVPGGGASIQAGGASATSADDWLAKLKGPVAPVGLSQPQELCSAPLTQAGGAFRCDAELFLGVPASAGAVTYRGLIVVTII